MNRSSFSRLVSRPERVRKGATYRSTPSPRLARERSERLVVRPAVAESWQHQKRLAVRLRRGNLGSDGGARTRGETRKRGDDGEPGTHSNLLLYAQTTLRSAHPRGAARSRRFFGVISAGIVCVQHAGSRALQPSAPGGCRWPAAHPPSPPAGRRRSRRDRDSTAGPRRAPAPPAARSRTTSVSAPHA